ncbi:MAG: metalloenzyme [Spirochaetia bacterium]|nr:metalloenzyme [Spirochaetia bacterium]
MGESSPDTLIYIFFDGIGFGSSDSGKNPLAKYKTYFLSPLAGGGFHANGDIIETDAHMGVEGVPQSATGQTALFTGYNASKIMGRHVSGFPTYSLRPYIIKYNLIKSFIDNNKKSVLINSYSEKYLNKIEQPKGERFMSATSFMQKSSGQPFYTIDDYLKGKALYMDITNWFLRSQGVDIEIIGAKITGRKLVSLARNFDLIVYEYFFPDMVGHDTSFMEPEKIICDIECFLEGIWEELDITRELVVICSDHGNFEDLSHSKHTENKVPTYLYGKGADKFKKNIKSIYHVPRNIFDLFNIKSDF